MVEVIYGDKLFGYSLFGGLKIQKKLIFKSTFL